jgi:hypothetical protein
MTGRRQQEVSLIVKAVAEGVALRSMCPWPAVQIDEECRRDGGDGEDAPGQRKADSPVSDWASMLECSADGETVLAGVRNLAEELNQLDRRGLWDLGVSPACLREYRWQDG